MGTGYSEGPGGKGSNQAIAARRLGSGVLFIGCIGTDKFGDEAMSLWKSEGISAGLVKRVTMHTGVALIVVKEGSGTNSITIDPGANLELLPSDVEAAEGAIGGCGVILTQLEIPPETAAAAARTGKAGGAVVILNPAPARPSAELDLSSVDIITPNEPEFKVLTGTRNLRGGAKALLKKGPRTVVVTLGERGAYVMTKDGSFRVPAPKVRAIDVTGAGDAFNGALAVALSEGEPLKQAVEFANLAGALTVTKKEVIPALPSRSDVELFRRTAVYAGQD